MRYLYRFFYFAMFIFIANIGFAQNTSDCKVLKAELSGEYTGDCKKGLASGNGEAKGIDRYVGTFKKGLPNGTGTYYYSTGAVYIGGFMDGKRHGLGKLTFTNEGKEIAEEGYWQNDNFIGKKPELPYEITLKRNIIRYSFVKTTDPRNIVSVKIIRNGNTIYPDNLMLSGSSGSIVQQKPFTNFEQIQYPFYGSIKYSLLTPFNNSYVDYELNFTIRESGYWEITLSH